jgi:hypothetical protein
MGGEDRNLLMAYQYDFGGATSTTGALSYIFQDFCILGLSGTKYADDYVEWDFARHDPSGMYDSDYRTRMTIKVAGYYLVGALIVWDSESTGQRRVYIGKNDSLITPEWFAGDERTAIGNTASSCNGLLDCSVDDYLQIAVEESSTGGNIKLTTLSYFWALRFIGIN